MCPRPLPPPLKKQYEQAMAESCFIKDRFRKGLSPEGHTKGFPPMPPVYWALAPNQTQPCSSHPLLPPSCLANIDTSSLTSSPGGTAAEPRYPERTLRTTPFIPDPHVPLPVLPVAGPDIILKGNIPCRLPVQAFVLPAQGWHAVDWWFLDTSS